MTKKLSEHLEKKAKKVNAWDVISAGLGLSATCLLAVSFLQDKNPINAFRLPVALGLFAGSVLAERARESDLLSFDRASEYLNNVKSDRIRLDTIWGVTEEDIAEAEERYARTPVDRWDLLHQRTGIAPPNYAARQPDPVLSQMQPEPMTGSAIVDEPDPSANFDPEPEELNQRDSSGSSFLFPDQVPSWFEELGDRCPPSLVEEWNQNPGIGIRVVDGSAHVVRREV